MPLFFMVSGLLFKTLDYKTLLMKAKIQLIIPFLAISFFQFFCVQIVALFGHEFDVKTAIRHLIGIFTANDSLGYGGDYYAGALWFCIALVMVKLITNWCFFNDKNKYVKVSLVCAMGGVILFIPNLLPLRIDSAFVGSIFFIIGYCFKDSIYQIQSIKPLMLWAVLLISFTCLIVCALFNLDFDKRQCLSINANYYGIYPPLFVISGISGSIFIFALSQLLSRIKNKFVLQISNGTIVILGFHWTIFKLFTGCITNTTILGACFYSIVNLLVCYILILLINKYVPFVLGNRKI